MFWICARCRSQSVSCEVSIDVGPSRDRAELKHLRAKEPVVSEPSPRPRRPAPFSDLTALIDAAGGLAQPVPSELAASTAAAVVDAGRTIGRAGQSVDSFVRLADRVGLDTLRALWRGAEQVSLANTLWTLYLLRSWCESGRAEIVRLWALGEPFAAADAVVAGMGPLADEPAVAALADAILVGAFAGDFAVALERAAAAFRVLASGRRQLPPAEATADAELAERNDRAADALTAAARRWRSGRLR
jgi:hypothetical protein